MIVDAAGHTKDALSQEVVSTLSSKLILIHACPQVCVSVAERTRPTIQGVRHHSVVYSDPG